MPICIRTFIRHKDRQYKIETDYVSQVTAVYGFRNPKLHAVCWNFIAELLRDMLMEMGTWVSPANYCIST